MRGIAQNRSPECPRRGLSWTGTLSTGHQAGERGYAGKKISGCKRHVALDCLGLILAIMINPTCVQDRDAARSLIQTVVSAYQRVQLIWAGGGYLGAWVNWVKQLRTCGKLLLEIVRLCGDIEGFKVLPRRWVVERTFDWFFKSRRLCRDYEVRSGPECGNDSELHDRIMVRRYVKAFSKHALKP